MVQRYRSKLEQWRQRGAALWQVDGAASRWLRALRRMAEARDPGAVPKVLKR